MYRLSSSPCWNTIISLLLSEVRNGGKNLPKYASTSSSQVSTEPYGNDSYHVAAISLKENGKRCSFYHLWPHCIQLHCICHPEESTQMLIGIFSGVASELMLLHHYYQSLLQFEVVYIHNRLSDCKIFFLNDGPPEILYCFSHRRPSGCCPLLLCLVMSFICHGYVLCSFNLS